MPSTDPNHYPELNRGDKSPDVVTLQTLLNKVGAMLVADGDFGGGTERGVRYAQDASGLPQTGTADDALWEWLEKQPEPFPSLHTNGIAFIALEETGGLMYYNSNTRWPHYPGFSSGITIGVGVDLRFLTEGEFRSIWQAHLPPAMLEELCKDLGKKGSKQRSHELKRMELEVPFKVAWKVFTSQTLPVFYDRTRSIYPSLDSLPDLCRSVLVSLVFNRGHSLKGATRREMREIRDILEAASSTDLHKLKRKMLLSDVEDRLVEMKRLWAAGSGLCKRRQSEANLWRKGLENW